MRMRLAHTSHLSRARTETSKLNRCRETQAEYHSLSTQRPDAGEFRKSIRSGSIGLTSVSRAPIAICCACNDVKHIDASGLSPREHRLAAGLAAQAFGQHQLTAKGLFKPCIAMNPAPLLPSGRARIDFRV
jgi:hypothetical protein